MKIWKRKKVGDLESAAASFLESESQPSPSGRLRDYGLQRILAREEAGDRARMRRRYSRSPSLAHRVIIVAIVVPLILALSTTGAYAFSSNALPGSALYGTKIFFERARVALTPGTTNDIQLEIEYSDRRMHELERMVGEGDQEGANRWLQEYTRNIDKAGSLLDASSGEEIEQLYLQFRDTLDRQAAIMEGIRGESPPHLMEDIDHAYERCNREREHVQQQCESCQQAPMTPGGQQGENSQEMPGSGGGGPGQNQSPGPESGGMSNDHMQKP